MLPDAKILYFMPWTPPKERSYEFGTGKVGNAFHIKFAEQVARRTKKYAIECWTLVNATPPLNLQRDGITLRLIPNVMADYPLYVRLAKRMVDMASDSPLIVEMHGGRDTRTWFFYTCLATAKIAGKRLGVVVQSHGWFTPAITGLVELPLLKRFDKIYALTPYELSYLTSMGLPSSKVRLSRVGVDFELFKPIDRDYARKVLGLPRDAFVVLYVSRFIHYKGIHHVINAVKQLRKSYGDKIVLVACGGYTTDPLYEDVVKTTPYVFTMVPHDRLPLYYSAANVTCNFLTDKRFEATASIGVPLQESLACGTPVISNLLRYNIAKKDISKVGVNVDYPSEIPMALDSLMNHPKEREICRQVAEAYYSWETIIRNRLKDYENVISHL
jgi:glycosyltransferase involved in cell wall biosynthesis